MIDINGEIDFYFAPKPHLIRIISEQKYNAVSINGEMKCYTEAIEKGKKPVGNWEDVVFVGTATPRDTNVVKLTHEEALEKIEQWKKDYPHLAPK